MSDQRAICYIAFGPAIAMGFLKAPRDRSGDEVAVPYMLDNTAAERVRLSRIALGLWPMTERLFRAAGIGPGMSVLDAGCGNGDVSFLAAELVSSSGHVIGFDRDPRQVTAASASVAALRPCRLSRPPSTSRRKASSTPSSADSFSRTSLTSSPRSHRWFVACDPVVWWPSSS